MEDDLSLDDITKAAMAIVDEAIERYRPSHVFGMFSGGHDSLCACHIASNHPEFRGCIHINTGIGVEETREFVRGVCRDMGWPLWEYYPPVTYEELVIEHGFPGPAHHWKMYQRLKERCIRQAMREHGNPRRKIAFISGRRAQESTRRMVNCSESIQEGPSPSKRAIWVNPIIDWSSTDKNRYIADRALPQNEVTKKLCMSGECLCGAFAKPNELEEIRMWYPDTAAQIDRIAAKVAANGQHAVWGTRPPKREKEDPNQLQLGLPLCSSCEFKHEMATGKDGSRVDHDDDMVVHACDGCGENKPCSFGPDPYMHEIEGVNDQWWLCGECRDSRAMEI